MQYAPSRPDFRFRQDGSYTRPTPVSGGFRRKAKAERREKICPGCRLEVSRAGVCVNC
jgi:hypothetical protein